MKMNNAKKIVKLTDKLQEIYAEILELGGEIVVNNNGKEMVLNHLRRGGTDHRTVLLPNDFYVSIGKNRWDD
jgi:hypothetical protein